MRRLASVVRAPTRAPELAAVLGKDPALVQLILDESREVIRAERGVLITETRHGFVCANAGIDTSNVAERRRGLLLPEDPDASARRIRAEIASRRAASPRWSSPTASAAPGGSARAEVAIGCAGLTPLDDWRGPRRRRRPRAGGDR